MTRIGGINSIINAKLTKRHKPMKSEKHFRTVKCEIMEAKKLQPVVREVTKTEIPASFNTCFIGD